MTIRNYKKAFWVGKDSFGKMIYAGDTVEVLMPWETRTPHTTIVHWNRMDGAFIDAHPSHSFLNGGMKHRALRDYLNQEPTPTWDYSKDEDGKIVGYVQGYVKKVKTLN